MNYNPEEIMNLCNKINEKIIDSYKTLKEDNFSRAYGYNNFKKDNNKNNSINVAEIFIMQNKIFRYTICKSSYEGDCSFLINYVNDKGSMPKSNSDSMVVSNFIGRFERYNNKLSLVLEQKNNKINEEIKTNNFSLFFVNYKKFFSYASKNYVDDKSIENKIWLLADLPSGMQKAHEDYKKSGSPSSVLINLVNKKLEEYDKSFDYVELYNNNPEFFLEKIETLPEEEKIIILQKLVKNTKFQAKKEIDDIISGKYMEQIAEGGRKGIGR